MDTKKKEYWAVLKTCGVFLLIFLISNGVCHLLLMNQRNQEALKASYTAEETVRRIETKLDKYLTKSELFKNIIESGEEISAQDFYRLADLMMDEEGVLQAFEMAKGGEVNMVYPMEGNEAAMGLDMLTHPQRMAAANLAKDSGRYTIAGPFELVQGGKGALLFDPIYKGANGPFWGFSILVIDWDAFVQQLGLENLENASYHYRIWRMDGNQKLILAQGSDAVEEDALEVECNVPNDVWYFDIIPAGGWFSQQQVWLTSLLCLIPCLLSSSMYWQAGQRREKDAAYARKIQETAEKAQAANAAKTRFLFNMSHDIRTPMNAIIGFSDLLEAHLDDPELSRNYAEKIKASGAFLLSLLNQVLEMARIESGKVSLSRDPVDLNAFLRDLRAVFEPSIEEKKLRTETEIQVADPYIWTDETKLREVLLNIVSNAVKYTPDGGSIRVTVEQLSEEPKEAGKALYQLRVTDTGIGMSEEYMPHLFEEFSREHSTTENRIPGTGLGMPIVKSLVDRMGGTIQAESRLGEGTSITIRLPFSKASREDCAGAGKTEAAQRSLAGKRVLLAEDNELNAEIAMTILREKGLQTEWTEDGAAAVELVKSSPEDAFDLILMDIQMPVMDGYQAAKAIRALPGRRGRLPILAVTANAFAEDRDKALECGMNGHIAKPIGMEKLLEEMGKWI